MSWFLSYIQDKGTVSGPTVKQVVVVGGHYSSYIGIKQRKNLTAAEIL